MRRHNRRRSRATQHTHQSQCNMSTYTQPSWRVMLTILPSHHAMVSNMHHDVIVMSTGDDDQSWRRACLQTQNGDTRCEKRLHLQSTQSTQSAHTYTHHITSDHITSHHIKHVSLHAHTLTYLHSVSSRLQSHPFPSASRACNSASSSGVQYAPRRVVSVSVSASVSFVSV